MTKVAHVDHGISLMSLEHPDRGRHLQAKKTRTEIFKRQREYLESGNWDGTHWVNVCSAFSHVLSWAPS